MKVFNYQDILFRSATTAEERVQLMRFCSEVYLDAFGREPVVVGDFDSSSTHFGAWREACPVGTLRCVTDGLRGLPMEIASGTSCDAWRARGKICEMGRLAIAQEMPNAPFVLLGLIRLSLWQAIENDVSFLLSCAPQRIWPLYQRMHMTTFGEPFQHPVGETFVLAVLDIAQVLSRTYEELKRGVSSSFLHEILEQRNSEEDDMVLAYLAERRALALDHSALQHLCQAGHSSASRRHSETAADSPTEEQL